MKVEELVRGNIKSLRPFSSARAEYTGDAKVLLDANESPYPTDYNRYPDPHQKELKEIIGSFLNIQTEEIILGNGSDEIIDLIVRTFCTPSHDRIRFIQPSFGMYEVVADINDVGKLAIQLDERFDLNVEACLSDQQSIDKLLFLCSPNNPTGNLLTEERVIDVIKGWKGLVIMDEAYIEYCERISLVHRLNEFKNLIVLQTFSKAMGGAGLRLGMGFAHAEVIQYLNKIKPPYNINSHTQIKAKTFLSQRDIINQRIERTILERVRVSEILSEIQGIERVFPSDTNFLLVRCREHLALYKFLCDAGIIVRDRSQLHGCQQCLRITIGQDKENDVLIDSVKKFYT